MNESTEITQREYWLDRLSGPLVKTRFPYDYQVSAANKLPFRTEEFKLPPDVYACIQSLSSGSDPKLFMVLTAGLAALLSRYSRETGIMVGAPIYKQNVEGDFINTVLTLKNQVEGDISFKDLLVQVRQTLLEAVKYQNYPLQRLVYELKLPTAADEFPLFDVSVLLENIHDLQYLDEVQTNILFSFRREEGTVKGSVRYQPSLYHPTTIRRIITHYVRLMAAMLTDIAAPVRRIRLMNPVEKDALMEQVSGPALDYPRHKTLHELFREQAEKHPDHTAVISFSDNDINKRKEIAYRELDLRSNQLARLLRKKNVSAGDLVGLMVEPSVEMAIGIFGILKAGAAYLPLDTAYPADRINYMIEDSGISLLVTRQECAEYIVHTGETVFFEDAAMVEEEDSPLAAEGSAAGLAYGIYTSGSTGKPKGVLVEHQSILNYIYWRIETYSQSDKDTSLQMVPFSFDGFCANFYPVLLTGGRTVLIDDDGRKDPDFLKSVIKQERVSNLSGVPSGLRLVLEGASEEDLSTINFIVAAGEKADTHLIKSARQLMKHARLINEYGPTESSVTAAAHLELTPETASVIGTPVSNNRLWVLDEQMNICPAGVWGELYISGASLAREYLGQPGLTGEKFPQNPHSAGERMYKTGDLVRWRFDGSLQISGRTDAQIKHRGFRIEPGEIETCLVQLETVKEAVVMLRESGGREGDLCAYIVAGEDVDIGNIRDHLMASLPGYMIPSYFVRLDLFPLTPSGKVDRRMLPALDDQTKAVVFTEYVAPRNSLEEKMAELWQNELEVEQVGIHDNYFNIGGDSIKSIPLINLVNETFGIDMKVVDLYENETVEKLALKVDAVQATRPSGDNEQYNAVLEEMDALKNTVIQGN
jgi:amino acid adenylation domain-containing protein